MKREILANPMSCLQLTWPYIVFSDVDRAANTMLSGEKGTPLGKKSCKLSIVHTSGNWGS